MNHEIKQITDTLKSLEQQKAELENALNSLLHEKQASFDPEKDGASGNIGDWSEVYVFFRLMEQGKIKTADTEMHPIYNSFLPVLKIIREEGGMPLEYYTSNELNGIKTMKIYQHGIDQPLLECNPLDFKHGADKLLHDLQTARKDKNIKTSSLSFPDHASFLNHIFIRKIKSPAVEISKFFGGKADITMEIIQNDNLHVPAGFSVKSAIGGYASIINAAKANDIFYKVHDCTDEIMETVNSIKSSHWVVDRVRYLEKNNITLTYAGAGSKTFINNLKLIADNEPEVVAYALLFSNQTPKEGLKSNRKMTDVVDTLIRKDPLNIGENASIYYTKRIKDLLFEYACGMNNDTPWNGNTKIQGGYIHVTKRGDVLAYYASNQDSYKDWLLNSTRFDMPSTSRHETVNGPHCGHIHKKDGEYFFTLSLGVRFKE